MHPKNVSDAAALKGVSNEVAPRDNFDAADPKNDLDKDVSILDVSDEGAPDDFKEGFPLDDFGEDVSRLRNEPAGDQVPSTSPKAEVLDSDADSEVPDSEKEGKTEVENIEIVICLYFSDKALTHNDEDNDDSISEQYNK